jgi:FkbM family methyltransferase
MNIYAFFKPLIGFYQQLFVRPSLYNLHFYLFNLGLRGMGVLNFENENASGELFLLRKLSQYFNLKICIDVGAHKGNYTKLLLKEIPNSKIFAIEPHPSSFLALKKRGFPKKVSFYQLALGERKKTIRLWDHSQHNYGSQHATIYQEAIEKLHRSKAKSVTVMMDTLDNFSKKNKIEKINFLKIDSEGSELGVISGAKKMIRRQKIDFIQFEFNSMNVNSRVFFDDFNKLLSGYSFFRLLTNGLIELKSNNPLENEIFAFQNILAVSHQKLKKFKSALES